MPHDVAATRTPWTVHLRIQKTGSSTIGDYLGAARHRECGWRSCPCQSRPPGAPSSHAQRKVHGERCAEVLPSCLAKLALK